MSVQLILPGMALYSSNAVSDAIVHIEKDGSPEAKEGERVGGHEMRIPYGGVQIGEPFEYASGHTRVFN